MKVNATFKTQDGEAIGTTDPVTDQYELALDVLADLLEEAEWLQRDLNIERARNGLNPIEEGYAILNARRLLAANGPKRCMTNRKHTPCVGVCSTLFDEVCRGCGRTAYEVDNWVALSEEARQKAWERLTKQGYPRRKGGSDVKKTG